MLTTTELRRHLERVTYRPGWAITVTDGRWEGQHLVIIADLPDASAKPGTFTRLSIHSALPPMRDTEQFEDWLAWRLGRIENHEMREWLRRDGKPIYDPHAPHADRDEEPEPCGARADEHPIPWWYCEEPKGHQGPHRVGGWPPP